MFHSSRVLLRVLLAVSALLSGLASAEAATVLNFPRLSHATGTFTGIAIANPTDGAAQVTLTAYGEDGQPLSGPGITNPAVITVAANEQFALTTYELFGTKIDPATIAWFQGTSSTNGLTGFFLVLDGSISYFDGADLPQSARQIVFNEVRLNGDFSTEVNLINPTNSRATVEVKLFGTSTVQTQSLTLEPMGVARLDIGPFFGLSSYPEKTYVTASSNVAIAGFNLIWSQGDVLGANARPFTEQLNTLFFPQLAVLGTPAFESELVVVSYSQETVILTLSAYQGDGSLFAPPLVQTNPVTRVLTAGQILREDVTGLFGFGGSTLQTGWIKVESTSEAINGSLTYRIPSSGSVATVAAEPLGRRQALFSHIATTLGYFTGAAILNGGSLAANIRIVALDEKGNLLGIFTTMLRPGERTSKLITEWVPAAADRNGGMIWVVSDVPVYMTGLFVNIDNGVLTNIAPQPVVESFRPDQGQARLKVSPALAVMVPNQTQTFDLSGTQGATWRVNGVVGGSVGTGTINTAGTYRAPPGVPQQLPVTVSAESSEQLAAASVDVLSKQVLIGGLGLVQSVAYLGGLQRLYTAELKILGGQGLRAPQADETNILDVTGTTPDLVVNYPGEEISKMVAFEGIDSKEYLLLAAKTTGKIIRLNPVTQQSVEVATGLNAPAAIVIDPLTGDLLVAQADEVTTIPSGQLNSGLTAQLAERGEQDQPLPQLTLPAAATGIAVDRCTGNIYLSDPLTGEILEYDRGTKQATILVTGLSDPGHLLAFYRTGLTCPDSLHLFVVEGGQDRIALIVPSDGRRLPWIEAPEIVDLAALPLASPLSAGGGVFLAESPGGLGRIALVPTPELYSSAINPPTLFVESGPWTTTSELPLERLLSVSASPGNGYLYAVGGYTGSTACSIGQADGRVFASRQNPNGTLATWQERNGETGNFRRVASAVAVNGGFIYIAGGAINAPSWDGNVWYTKPNPDGSIGSWSQDSLPGSPSWLGSWPVAAVHNGYLYVGGGRHAFQGYTDRLYYAPLNPNGSAGTWTKTALPSPSAQGQLVFFADKAYLILGIDDCDGCVTDKLFMADVGPDGSLSTWVETTPLPNIPSHASAQIIDGHLVVLLGGTDFYESEILGDGSLGAWNSLTSLPESSLPSDQGVYSNGYYYVIGDQNCGATSEELKRVVFTPIGF